MILIAIILLAYNAFHHAVDHLNGMEAVNLPLPSWLLAIVNAVVATILAWLHFGG